MKYLVATISFMTVSLLPLQSFAEEMVTRAEYDALVERVANLEGVIASLKADVVDQAASAALESPQFALAPSEGTTFIDDVVDVIHSREEDAFYPWMDMAKWERLEVGMTEGEVNELLGQPTMRDPSMHKKVDSFYTYTGRRVATGKRVKGVVRFYRGKVKNFDAPAL
jgi:hypothetical protein